MFSRKSETVSRVSTILSLASIKGKTSHPTNLEAAAARYVDHGWPTGDPRASMARLALANPWRTVTLDEARAIYREQVCQTCGHWPVHESGRCEVPCDDDAAVRCGCRS